MDGMKDLMESLASKRHLELNLNSDEKCYKHIPSKYQEENEDPDYWEELKEKYAVNLMAFKGSLTCPRCRTEESTRMLEKAVEDEVKQQLREIKRNMIRKSVITDETIKMSNFDKYIVNEMEESENKRMALQAAEDYKQGKHFNLWIVSPVTGVGKSHLAMSILKYVNSYEQSTLFIDIDAMLREIKKTFKDKESKYTEAYFVDLCTSVDLLVIDDLGAEIGKIKTDKESSDWSSRILTAIMNARQGRSTIITTNLDSNTLNNIYDRRLISRMLSNRRVIKFEKTKDKRTTNIEF